MAERRMFAKTIVTSDAFLDMPPTARCLYFLLAMLADDDGFVNSPKSIMRQAGATTDDLKLLIAKRFILTFESGVVVIKHWRIHNLIQKDRYKETTYLEEKSLLTIDDNKAYTEAVYPLDTECIQDVSTLESQVSIGKVSKGKVSVVEGSVVTATTTVTNPVESPVENSEDNRFKVLNGIGKGVIYLTDTQFGDLLDRLDIETFNSYIERLADFIIEKKAHVKSHYDTILKWVAEDSRVGGRYEQTD